VKQAIDTLATYSLFVEENEDKICRIDDELTALSNRIKRDFSSSKLLRVII